MKMHKEWSSFRITLLLYAIVLIIPLTFYFIYTSFNVIDTDTKIVRQVGWLDGSAMTFTIDSPHQNNQQLVKNVDKTLQNISAWVTQNNDSKFYLGAQTLSKDLLNVTTCWNVYKQNVSTHDTDTAIKQYNLNCMNSVKNLTTIIENMIYLKQKDFINMFYWNLATLMMITVLLIYLVRAYIHTQMKKHAIHDHDSKLFNKKYFMAELKTTCSRSARHNYPLSILCVSIDNFEKENKTYNKRTKRNTLKVFGILMHALVRDGDIPCRYDENHFCILLPFTEQENALLLEDRIRQALEKDNWMRSNKIVFRFRTTEFDQKESEEAFLTRTLNQSQLRG